MRFAAVIFVSILTATTLAHGLTCEAMFHEQPRGQISYLNQNAKAVREAGLFSDTPKPGSQVCGPTCLLNFVMRFNRFQLLPAAAASELKHLVNDLAPLAGVSAKSIRDGGISAYDLASLASVYFTELGFSPRIKILGIELNAETLSETGRKGRTGIVLEEVRPGPNRLVIVNYEHWRTDDIRNIRTGDKKTGWFAGHFVILDSLRIGGKPGFPEAAAHVVFHDPGRGRDRAIYLRPAGETDLGIETFELIRVGHPNFRKSDASVRTLITNVIVIDF